MTSHDVVDLVRRKLPKKTKVGHLGTLDPAAAGVLPLAIGGATKLIPLVPNLGGRMKGYLARIKFGVETSTDDLEGDVLSEVLIGGSNEPDLSKVTEELQAFLGAIQQVPPQVSAIRQDGKRAYERVRAGEDVELPPREVVIDKLELLSLESPFLKLYMVCGSGTYVRSLARDLGRKLGLGGALAFLLRTHSGPFHLEQANSLEEFLSSPPTEHLLPSEFPFLELPKVETNSPLGQKGQLVEGEFPHPGLLRASGGLVRLQPDGRAAVVEALFEDVLS